MNLWKSNQSLVIYGGKTSDGFKNDLWYYNIEDQEFIEKAQHGDIPI